MRAVMLAAMPAALFCMVGCAKPVVLQVSVVPPVPAEVSLTLVEGEVAASPGRCDAPCAVEVAPSTTHEVTIRSPETYPAHFRLPYDAAASAERYQPAPETQLIVPLVRRPTTTVSGEVSEQQVD